MKPHHYFVFMLAIIPMASRAQSPAAPRWAAWRGCWANAPHTGNQSIAPDDKSFVCVTPLSSADVAEIAIVDDGNVVTRDTVDASGRERTRRMNGCDGVQRASWSNDGRRVFMRSTRTCGKDVTETQTMLALTGEGDWLDIRRVAAGDASSVRVARYRAAPENRVPREFASGADSIVTRMARLDAGRAIGDSAIVEATRLIDAEVLRAFVMESGQRFATDAYSITHLADAGVPGGIMDAMIGIDTPTGAVNIHQPLLPYGAYNDVSKWWDQGTGMHVVFGTYNLYDPFGFGYYFLDPLTLGPIGSPLRQSTSLVFGVGFGNMFSGTTSLRSGGRRSSVGYYYPPVLVLHNEGAVASTPVERAPLADRVSATRVSAAPSKPDKPDDAKALPQPRNSGPTLAGVSTSTKPK